MDHTAAAEDLRYIRTVLDRTRRRIDPHAFHFVSWGAIVLLWYPASNLLERAGDRRGMLVLGIAALLLGTFLSGFLEWRLRRRPRLAGGEDTFVGRQVVTVVWGCLGAATLLSIVGPTTGMIDGPRVPLVWGYAYAVMAFGVGVVYSREYLWAALFIFAGCVAAMATPGWEGVILGPAMGLGLMVPGLVAERRVRRMAAEDLRGASGG